MNILVEIAFYFNITVEVDVEKYYGSYPFKSFALVSNENVEQESNRSWKIEMKSKDLEE